MVWETQKFTKKEINKAGDILINDTASEQEKERAIEILNNWRACHSYPLHIFQMTLKNKALKVDNSPLTAQRLKRIPAIIYKLKRSYDGRKPSMKLFQMQDLGGCRAIVTTINQARELCDNCYLRGDLKHKRVVFKDYIKTPKPDGYRSIHIIYEYKSDKGKKEYNGLRVEVQIRSNLQHIWATAIETVDLFTRQAIKSSEGHPDWADFFRLVSSAFAKMENCECVPNTPNDKKELYSQIKQKENMLNVITRMKGWTNAMHFFDEEIKGKKRNVQFFLLELDIIGSKLNISSYTKEEEQKAINDYSAIEKRHSGRKDYDMVLVGVDTTADLKKAYPNYFVDTNEFVVNLQKILNY